jgi:hypothetical protein
MTYFEFTKRFPDETSAINFIVAAKYKNGYVCPKCGCVEMELRRNELPQINVGEIKMLNEQEEIEKYLPLI